MHVVVVSDTHIRNFNSIDIVLREDIKSADAVIHAGDFGHRSLYDEMDLNCKILYAVQGNNDDDSFKIPRELTIELEGVVFCIMHGDKFSSENRENALLNHFYHHTPDIIVYGHTHIPKKTDVGRPVLLNPGSPTRGRSGYNSYATVDISCKNFQIVINKLIKEAK
jgi:putative phosphoesterase